MNARLRAGAAAARAGSSRLLPIACVVVWIVAAAGARVLGVWLAVGGAAIALGVAVWALDRRPVTAVFFARARA